MSTWQTIINSKLPILIDFYRDGCDGCITMDAVIEQLKMRLPNQVEIIQIDINELPQARQFFKVESVPTLILFHQDNLLWKHGGLITSLEAEKVIKSKI